MKTFLITLLLALALQLPAQSNAPIRLALISETDAAAPAVDVLTAQFSANPKLQLLERDQIARVYREQGLSAANTDYLKLGQLLGADGLLLLQVAPEGTNQVLNTRLIAVKPGVALVAEKYPWPLSDPTGWTAFYARHLDVFLPKLTVLVKDAIPLSIVNFRSAVTSAEAGETERQLRLLTIQRLTREPQLFVLERQKLQLLGEEKELKNDDAPFWNGGYLLEGVLDQNGYSPDSLTLNARLTPPKGGPPMTFEVSAARTNLVEIVNQLAMKLDAALKVNAAAPTWNAADEAAQYYAEGQWALRWGEYAEAQTAAESAWWLGKRDEECAILRVRARLPVINTGGYTSLPFVSPNNLQEVTNSAFSDARPNPPWGLIVSREIWGDHTNIYYVYANQYPDTNNLDRALAALALYHDFSATLPPAALRPDSAWYALGIDDLTTASKVLQQFHFVHSSQASGADQLARVRAMARTVAGWLAGSPAVRDSYRLDNQTGGVDYSARKRVADSLFNFEVTWGCFWQDTPEACVAFYLQMMSDPAFRAIHQEFWIRYLPFQPLPEVRHPVGQPWDNEGATAPILTAWNDADRNRIPMAWQDFIQALNNSTNRLLQIEGAAATLTQEQIQQRDAEDWQALRWTQDDEKFNKEKEYLHTWGYGHADDTQFNPAEFLTTFQFRDYLPAQAAQLSGPLESFIIEFNAKAKTAADGDKANLTNAVFLARTLQSDVNRIVWADEDRRNRADAERRQAETDRKKQATFEKQVQFLKDQTPYDPPAFVALFYTGLETYTPAQALQLRPLLAAYRTNLTGIWAASGSNMIHQMEAKVNRILNPPPPRTNAPMVMVTRPPATNHPPVRIMPPTAAPRVTTIPPAAIPPEEPATNIVAVHDYIKMPVDRLEMPYAHDLFLSSHCWSDGKLLLDLRYDGQNGKNANYLIPLLATAIYDPVGSAWQVIYYPRDIEFPDNEIPDADIFADSSLVLFQGGLYMSYKSQIRRYDLSSRQWQSLNFPGQKRSQLFVLDGHLYAANDESIIEILDQGKTTRLLASIRRRPAVGPLDLLDGLGAPFLFLRTNNVLTARVMGDIYTWEHDDWLKTLSLSPPPPDQQPLDLLPEGFLYHTEAPLFADVWVWENGRPAPELWLKDHLKPAVPGNLIQAHAMGYLPGGYTELINGLPVGERGSDHFSPRIYAPLHDYMAGTVATFYHSRLYFLVDHTQYENQAGKWTVVPKNGYNVRLFCVSRPLEHPVEVPLNLDLSVEQASWGDNVPGRDRRKQLINPNTWMRFVGDNVYIGQDYTLGCWVLPVAKLEAALADATGVQLAKTRQDEEARRQWQARMTAQFGPATNPDLDPVKKAAAMDDPDFIAWELDNIDTNHNGWLDLGEFAWFDANHNQILDPKEQAGMEIAQHLLAERLFKQFDEWGDGLLDQDQFRALIHAAGIQRELALRSMYVEHVDLPGVESLLNQQSRLALRIREIPGMGYPGPAQLNGGIAIDARQQFKTAVEAYWQNPGSVTNPLSPNPYQPRPATP